MWRKKSINHGHFCIADILTHAYSHKHMRTPTYYISKLRSKFIYSPEVYLSVLPYASLLSGVCLFFRVEGLRRVIFVSPCVFFHRVFWEDDWKCVFQPNQWVWSAAVSPILRIFLEQCQHFCLWSMQVGVIVWCCCCCC